MKCTSTLTQLAILAAATTAVAWFPARWSVPAEPVTIDAPVVADARVGEGAPVSDRVLPTFVPVEQTPVPVLVAQDTTDDDDPGVGDEPDEDAALATAIANVQTFYESVEDFHADFTQEFANLTLGTTQTSTGHVYFKTPGLMRWDYQSPTQRFMMRDGENLWIYEPEEGQYYTQPMDETDLPTALRFLMGEGTHLEFVVDTTTWHVTETVIYDPIGNANRLTFTRAEVNSGLPDSGFQFTPPEGATQIQTPN